MLRASATAVRSVIKDSTLFDLDTSARQTMTLREGDELGASRAARQVTPNSGIVVAENGDIATMSIDYLPERAFDINDVSTGVEAAASDPSATDS